MATPTLPDVSEVTTEPQRRALDEMSNQLTQRLNDMIAEQNARAQAFAAQQHSISSLPEISVPVMPNPEPVVQPALVQPPPARTKPKPAQRSAAPKLPAATQLPASAPPLPFEIPAIQKKPAAKESSGGCSGWMIAVGTFILFILLKSCD